MIHFFALFGVTQSSQEFIDTPQAHDFILDGVVRDFKVSELLLKGFFDDAESKIRYLAVSLQRILRP